MSFPCPWQGIQRSMRVYFCEMNDGVNSALRYASFNSTSENRPTKHIRIADRMAVANHSGMQ
jgi:hypothetical protein